MPVNETWLAQTAGQHQGEIDRVIVKSTEYIDDPNFPPNTMPPIRNLTPDYIITYGDGTKMVVRPTRDATGQATGEYNVVDQPALPSGATRNQQLVDLATGGKGILNPDGSVTPIAGTGSRPTGQWVGGVYYQGDPNDPNAPPGAVQFDPGTIAQQQQTADIARRRLQLAEQAAIDRQVSDAAKAKRDDLETLMKLGQMDEKTAEREWEQWYKTNVELPRVLHAEEQKRIGEGIEYGRNVGESAVADVTKLLPYRYSPGFMQRREAALGGLATGNFQQAMYGPLAQSYRGPDLAATRAQAQGQGQRYYEQQLGFDPLEVAGQVPYRAPAAAGVMAAPGGVSDDEEVVKQLAQRLAAAHPVPRMAIPFGTNPPVY